MPRSAPKRQAERRARPLCLWTHLGKRRTDGGAGRHWHALIAAEAAWRLDRGDLVEVEIDNRLQRLAGRPIARGFG